MQMRSIGQASAAGHSGELAAVGAKADIDGVFFSPETRSELCSGICGWLRSDSKHGRIATYVNPHVFNVAKRNQTLRDLLRTADIVAVDGIGFALAVRWLTGYAQTRTVMTPLFDDVLATETLPQLRAVLIGGATEVMEEGAKAINRATGRIEIIATYHGYATCDEHLHFLRAHSEIDVVLVAMGSPRSEELIARARGVCAPKLFWNIGGGTLHFYAGTLKRVPQRISRLGLQWLWRIVHEPTIAPRYVIGVPKFLASVARCRIQKTTQPAKIYGSAYR